MDGKPLEGDAKSAYSAGVALGNFLAREILQRVSREMIRGTSGEGAQDGEDALPVEHAQGMSRRVFSEISQEILRRITQDLSQWVSPERSQEVAQKLMENIASEEVQTMLWETWEQAERSAKRMLASDHYTQEEIAKTTSLSLEYIQNLAMQAEHEVS